MRCPAKVSSDPDGIRTNLEFLGKFEVFHFRRSEIRSCWHGFSAKLLVRNRQELRRGIRIAQPSKIKHRAAKFHFRDPKGVRTGGPNSIAKHGRHSEWSLGSRHRPGFRSWSRRGIQTFQSAPRVLLTPRSYTPLMKFASLVNDSLVKATSRTRFGASGDWRWRLGQIWPPRAIAGFWRLQRSH